MAVAVLCGSVGPARADGAFPNSKAILLPRDRPSEIVLATTFGLVFSEDDGNSWRYSCENDTTRMLGPGQYIMGPPPDDRIYVKADVGLAFTTDGACTWALSGGDLVSAPPLKLPIPIDVFPDPTDPLRVFALATTPEDRLVSLFRSVDAGLNYVGPIFKPPAGMTVTGIEAAASESGTVYQTLYEGSGIHPWLATSHDAGDTWTMFNIETAIGSVVPRLAAVDPVDARRVYLRIASASDVSPAFEALAISSDGGATWTIPLTVPGGSLVGFARRSDGNIFVVGFTAPTMSMPDDAAVSSPVPAAFRSDDGGLTFTSQTLPFHPIGLAERNGVLFAATDNFMDGFAIASSDDGGQTWTPRLKFRDIVAVKDCVTASCQADCDFYAGSHLFPPEVCNPLSDAGTDKPAKSHPGCGCAAGGPTPARRTRVFSDAFAVVVVLFGLRRRRAPRGT